jgi:predicted transcriptional regulator
MKKVFVIILLFTLIPRLVLAEGLYQYSVTIEIYDNNTAHHRLNLIFLNHSEKSFSINLGLARNIMIKTGNCEYKREILGEIVKCNLKPSQRTDIVILYDTGNIQRVSNYFVYTNSFKLNFDTENFFVLIKLPEGTGLRKPVDEAYSPKNALIGSDGRRTTISWQESNLNSGETFDVSIAFEKIGEAQNSFPFEIILLTVIVVLAILFYHFYSKRSLKLIMPVLKKDEKIIFDTILKHGNGVKQKIIVKESGYSKAKVSKVLNSLKERGLIRLERVGRTNKIYIERKFKKKE